MLPAWVGYLRSLKELKIWDLANLKCLPNSIRQLTKLETLDIGYSGVECLPPWIMELNNLVRLAVMNCPLRKLPFNRFGGDRQTGGNSIECMLGLRDLTLDSTKISAVTFGRGACPNLEGLYIFSCPLLAEVRALPNSLTNLYLCRCDQLEKIDGLCGLAKLKTLKIRKCPKVKEISGLGTLTSLQRLHLHKCGVAGILDLQQLRKLRVLKVLNCHALEELAGFEHLRLPLWAPHVSRCHNLRWVEDLSYDTIPTDDDASMETYLSDDTCPSDHTSDSRCVRDEEIDNV